MKVKVKIVAVNLFVEESCESSFVTIAYRNFLTANGDHLIANAVYMLNRNNV